MPSSYKRTGPSKGIKVLAIVVIAVAVIAGLELTNTTHFFHKTARVSGPTKPITSLPSSGKAKPKDVAAGNLDVNNGSSTDKKGQVPSGVSSDPSQWSTSTSGLITVKSPVANGTLASGGTITGTASSGPVQYRLIDDQVGIIAQGAISVVNGNFTATIQFKHYANTGRLDIFNTGADGREINEVQVTVSF